MENTTKTKHKVAKAVLAMYPAIQGHIDTQMKRNYLRAMGGFNNVVDTQTLMERIIDKAYQIQRLHNLKLKVEQRLEKMPTTLRTALTMAHFENLSAIEIAERMGVSVRTAFRYTAQALDWFANGIEKMAS